MSKSGLSTVASFSTVEMLSEVKKCLSKVIEKAVSCQVTDHVDGNNLSEELQSSYKSKHSTETALSRCRMTFFSPWILIKPCTWSFLTCWPLLTQSTTAYSQQDSIIILELVIRFYHSWLLTMNFLLKGFNYIFFIARFNNWTPWFHYVHHPGF